MSADRTLMAIIRTALSLISFGFTIFQFFHKLSELLEIKKGNAAAREFGVALVLLGIGMLALGIGYHLAFMYRLRKERMDLVREGYIQGDRAFPISLTLITALLLLVVGLLAIVSMVFSIGPFG